MAVGIGGGFKFSVAVGVGVTCKGSEVAVAVHQSYGGKFMELVVGHPVFFTVSPGKVDFYLDKNNHRLRIQTVVIFAYNWNSG